MIWVVAREVSAAFRLFTSIIMFIWVLSTKWRDNKFHLRISANGHMHLHSFVRLVVCASVPFIISAKINCQSTDILFMLLLWAAAE